MNNKLKNLYHKNAILNKIGRSVINIKNYPINSYYEICENRKKYEVWNYKEISEDLKMYLEDTSPDGLLYGTLHWIKVYAGIKNHVNMYVEHGLYFGNLVRDNSINSIYKGTITFSEHRATIVKDKTDKKISAVGPYIHYAQDYYSNDKINRIKNENGKTLLFFPTHSIKNYDAEYDVNQICERLNDFKSYYNTILICLFYKDVNNGLARLFEKQGFTVVSAGHYYDYYFLSRLKSIIKLADHTMSTTIGTHIGYCIYMGKSHEIINENRDALTFGETNRALNVVKDKEVKKRGENYSTYFNRDEEEILNNFFNTGDRISDNQIEVCKKFWGFDEIKTLHELRRLLVD